jgi:hypothetical protein
LTAELHTTCAKRIEPTFSAAFASHRRLFHIVFNRTVENFYRPFIIRASSWRTYGAKVAPAKKRLLIPREARHKIFSAKPA